MDTKIDLKSRASRLAKQLEEDIRKTGVSGRRPIHGPPAKRRQCSAVSTSTADRAIETLGRFGTLTATAESRDLL